MNIHVSKFQPINPFDPETLLSLASDLKSFRRTGHPVGIKEHAAPVISSWSRTLLPHPAVIGSLNHETILRPIFAMTEDQSWALLNSGWHRLEDHVEKHFSTDHRIRR